MRKLVWFFAEWKEIWVLNFVFGMPWRSIGIVGALGTGSTLVFIVLSEGYVVIIMLNFEYFGYLKCLVLFVCW